ncbi:MAG TPA: hypothetical protein VK466_14135, partial [Terriglobales bacterium]|nr:hypothetical protein [Terriglobales bacterium]
MTPAAYHLHPRYRAKLPLEATFLKVDPALDRFPTEAHADRIEKLLADWSEGLRQSSVTLRVLRDACSANFVGVPWQPADSRIIRSNGGIEVRRNSFAKDPALGRDAFVKELKLTLQDFKEIHTAEFQITEVEASAQASDASLRTRVRYEIAGPGRDFHREQRVGEWDLTWTVRGGA